MADNPVASSQAADNPVVDSQAAACPAAVCPVVARRVVVATDPAAVPVDRVEPVKLAVSRRKVRKDFRRPPVNRAVPARVALNRVLARLTAALKATATAMETAMPAANVATPVHCLVVLAAWVKQGSVSVEVRPQPMPTRKPLVVVQAAEVVALQPTEPWQARVAQAVLASFLKKVLTNVPSALVRNWMSPSVALTRS